MRKVGGLERSCLPLWHALCMLALSDRLPTPDPTAMIRRFLPVFLSAAALTMPAVTTTTSHAHEAGAQMAEVAKVLLATLTPEQKAKASFAFDDEERLNWHFVPKVRNGLPLKDMTPQQELLAHALLNTGMGFRGAAKAVTIMSLEEVLFHIEGADEAKREAILVDNPARLYGFLSMSR